jgi:multiple antibiotic resistance protein
MIEAMSVCRSQRIGASAALRNSTTSALRRAGRHATMSSSTHGFDLLIGALQLGFPALFSIVNPIGGAFVFDAMTSEYPPDDQGRLARKVALYSLAVLMVSLWAGAFVLNFFGVSLAALRCAGGTVVALNAWRLLTAPASETVPASASAGDIAFYPLTMPVTAGPGTISVAVALSSKQPRVADGLGWFFLGMSLAALAVAATIWLTYGAANRITRLFGEHGAQTFTRLMAFLLLCIGVQVLITGVQDVFDLTREAAVR